MEKGHASLRSLELAVEHHLAERRRSRDRRRMVASCLVAAVAGVLVPVGAMYAWRQMAIWSAAVEPGPPAAASVLSEPRVAAPLTEGDRRAVYRALVEAEDRALADAVGAALGGREPTGRARTETLKRQHRRFVELAAQYRSEAAATAARRYGIGPDEIREIEMEGARSDWMADVEAPGLLDPSLAEAATQEAEPSPPRVLAEMRSPAVTPPGAAVRPARPSAAPASEPIALPPRSSPLGHPGLGQSARSDAGGQ